MTQLFRSKSCVLSSGRTMFDSVPPPQAPPSLYLSDEEDSEEEEEEEYEYESSSSEEDGNTSHIQSSSTPLMDMGGEVKNERNQPQNQQSNQFPILAILLEALRKSLVTCSVDREDICSPDIGWPTDVQHVSHVTFDRFNGFLGLPVEFEPELPRKVPSASACVFGVSAESMQCSYDHRGNCVPTILLLMQKRLYSEGGLEAEGIFRINAENSQEDYVRDQLNRGLVPYGIDVHCLAGLIKAWFRELPKGVLDSLTPDQVMNCNTEDDCTQVVSLLPPMDAALLAWAINLMADVVQREHQNKMNARNIAMVFAPNMTQMADPLTALLHAVQVMNFLKTLILKTIREREESAANAGMCSSCSDSPNSQGDHHSSIANGEPATEHCEPTISVSSNNRSDLAKLFSSSPIPQESDTEDNFYSFNKKGETKDEPECASGDNTPVKSTMDPMENVSKNRYSNGDVEGFNDRLSWREGVKKLCKHPVFQLSKPIKKNSEFDTLNTREGGGEAWA